MTEPVPVADQLAAGVARGDTVTMADQAAGADAPLEVQVTADAPMADPAASNASPQLPANAQAAAARAHAAAGTLIAVLAAVRSDIERYVPADMIKGAEAEARRLILASTQP